MSNAKNSKELILKQALSLFSERGYDSVGISEITKKAGLTKPTLYYFFQSKEGLFTAILETYYSELNRCLAKAAVYVPNNQDYYKDVFPVLCAVMNAYTDFAHIHQTFYTMVLSLSFAPPSASATLLARPYFSVQYSIITTLFKDISQMHHNMRGKEVLYAQQFIASCNAAIVFWYQNAGEIEENPEAIVRQFMHGIFS